MEPLLGRVGFLTPSATDSATPASRGTLFLDDGTRFDGVGFGAEESRVGEVVFTTGMVGYPESLTDPSFRGQILTFTYPLLGNYGIPDPTEKDSHGLPKFLEADSAQVRGVVVRGITRPHHWALSRPLERWLSDEGVPGIAGVDTRRLTEHLRTVGVRRGVLVVHPFDEPPIPSPELRRRLRRAPTYDQEPFVAEVGVRSPKLYRTDGGPIVAVLDCGIKASILRALLDRGVSVLRLPYDHEVPERWDGIRVSGLLVGNGPGDPAIFAPTVEEIARPSNRDLPTLGICLGQQLLALSRGGSTFKLKYGHRGQNKTVCFPGGKALILSENHGYAVDPASLRGSGLVPWATNPDDGTLEGLKDRRGRLLALQGHPEGHPGPQEAGFVFDEFVAKVRPEGEVTPGKFGKILVLGSGALKIGEAGEFDYSGSQCLKALEEEGIYAVVVNPNIATLQTDPPKLGRVYFQPLTPDFVEPILEAEHPDAVLLSFGGQTALNCGIGLADRGAFRRHGAKVLGTPLWGIRATEDRAKFVAMMKRAKVPTLPSFAVYSLEEARVAAERLGFPVIVRVAFTLGGKGGGVARDAKELEEVAGRGLRASPVGQILLERYVGAFKQIEYEVVRDVKGNALTVCNMENVLGMRVHTGDNIVIAPSQTLTDAEYQMLRQAALRAVEVCGIIGECNIQFALNPESEEYYAIEINARLSRSSALASKATGYPLAYVATKLALGYTLPELKNRVTGVTTACFEPALDYVVVKLPRWDLDKFAHADRSLGPSMKSVGEVMGIGASFPEALLKAVRMSDPRAELVPPAECRPLADILPELSRPEPEILYRVLEALRAGAEPAMLEKSTWIDQWFIHQLAEVEEAHRNLGAQVGGSIPTTLLRRAKELGLSDRAIARAARLDEEEVRKSRLAAGIRPRIRMIDTLAGEWPSTTNYLYVTYRADADDVRRGPKGGVLVLGAGPYRIGSSVEFDWSTMNLVDGLKAEGVPSVALLNSNPETVSTDYDRSDRLYFEEITLERVRDLFEFEKFRGVVTCVGSQLAQNLTPLLETCGIPVLGTSPKSIDTAEDRAQFARLLERLKIPQPAWKAFTTMEAASAFADEVGYPVLVRPSYVLSGQAMRVIAGRHDLARFLTEAVRLSPEYPVVITKFVEGADEVELDAISDGRDVLVGGILEHVERAGVHSGDAIFCLPPRHTSAKVQAELIDAAERLARALDIRGPFNVQFLVKDDAYQIIELNLRASRSLPFLSKATGVPLPREAARAILGRRLTQKGLAPLPPDRWGVKVPQFSFLQITGSDPLLGVEMQSTGEVACFGPTFADALVKALVATGVRLIPPGGTAFLSVGGTELKQQMLPAVRRLADLGFRLAATEDTAAFLSAQGFRSVKVLHKVSEPDRLPNVVTALDKGEIDLMLNVPSSLTQEKLERMLEDEYVLRRRAVELGIPLHTNLEAFIAYVEGVAWLQDHPLTVEALYGSPEPGKPEATAVRRVPLVGRRPRKRRARR